jgi:alpha-tubulin suppressor-like RCC1 family protein
MFRVVGLALLSWCAAAAGCQVFLPAMGGEGQSCFENKTCKPGLVCEDGVCRARVVPDAGDGGDSGDSGDSEDGSEADASDGWDGGADEGGDGDVSPTDGDGFIPACSQNETRCLDRELYRCEDPGIFKKDHRCNIGCDAAGVGCLKVLDIACGGNHTCAVISDGRVFCWGANDQAQLGRRSLGGTKLSPEPVFFNSRDELQSVQRVALSFMTSCALRKDDSVVCWGRNEQGECGSASGGTPIQYPVQVLTDAVALVGGTWTSFCAITTQGQAKCWGCPMMGNGCFQTSYANFVPSPIAGLSDKGSVVHMGLGTNHACAVVDEGGTTRAYCYGDGHIGQLGNASNGFSSSSTPVPVDNSEGWIGVGCADLASFGWSAAGTYSWGSESAAGVLGDGSALDHYIGSPGPLLLRDGQGQPLPVRYIRGGFRHVCAEVGAEGGPAQIYCWGSNSGGQTGQSTTGGGVFFSTPLPVDNLPPVRRLAVGWTHNCAILEDDESVVCWGNNAEGQLGVANILATYSPVPVTFP